MRVSSDWRSGDVDKHSVSSEDDVGIKRKA